MASPYSWPVVGWSNDVENITREEALELSERLQPLEERLRQARREGLIHSEYLGHQIGEAERAEVITATEATELQEYHEKLEYLLAVDDFPRALDSKSED